MLRLLTVFAALAMLSTQTSAASFTVFTDRTAFEAASGAGLATETFDGIVTDTSFAGAPVTIGALTISAEEPGAFGNQLIDAPAVLGEVDGNGTTAINFFTTATEDAAISFAAPVLAFGADFFNLNDISLRTEIVILDGIFQPAITADDTLSFFGVISDTAFSSVTFAGLENDVFGVDNVSTLTAAVPLPATLPMLIVGIAGFAAVRRFTKSA